MNDRDHLTSLVAPLRKLRLIVFGRTAVDSIETFLTHRFYHAAVATRETRTMQSRVTLLSCFALSLSAAGWLHGQPKVAEPPKLTDAEIRLLLVRESIASYSGACPCPDSRNGRGARCGGNSA